jgi:hypothetical protein
VPQNVFFDKFLRQLKENQFLISLKFARQQSNETEATEFLEIFEGDSSNMTSSWCRDIERQSHSAEQRSASG